MSVIATIISAIIGAGTTLDSSTKQIEATKKAGKESRELAEITRQDQLAAQRRSTALGREQMGLTRQSLAMQKEEADLGRAERSEERSYNRLQDRWQRGFDVLNSNQQLLKNLSAKFKSRRGA